jgi:hypothetical protein
MENQTETNPEAKDIQNEAIANENVQKEDVQKEEQIDKGIKLGEMIELSGFSHFDRSEMIIIKKLIGNYVRKFIDYEKGFSSLKVTAKKVHEREKSVIFEFHLILNLSSGSPIAVDSNGRNAFMALDEILKNAEEILKKV